MKKEFEVTRIDMEGYGMRDLSNLGMLVEGHSKFGFASRNWKMLTGVQT